jgi:hypothetical protein
MSVPCLFVRRLGVEVIVPSMKGILLDVAERHGFSVEDLKRWSIGFTKDPRELARTAARDEAMWLMWNLPDPGQHYTGHRYSLPQIGGVMRCHHTTVLAASRRHGDKLSTPSVHSLRRGKEKRFIHSHGEASTALRSARG